MSLPVCPHCHVSMRPVVGYPGLYRCPIDPEHTADAEPAPAEEAARRPVGPEILIDVAKQLPPPRYWLAGIGITGPLPAIKLAPQQRDGSYCLPLGEIARGGGGGTGRKRKKGDRGGKKYVDTAWESQPRPVKPLRRLRRDSTKTSQEAQLDEP